MRCRSGAPMQEPAVHGSRGFTLVETMIVVVIVGVLASLATYGVRSYIRHAKTAEARQMILAIKAGEESYREETYQYLSSATTISERTVFPQATCSGDVPGMKKWSWEQPAGADCAAAFRSLGVTSTAPVQYGYVVVAVTAGQPMPDGGSLLKGWSWGSFATATGPAYAVVAVGDLDGDGTFSAFLSSSLSDEFYAENEDD
jgi:prepilin-type N-terminal cleavage/methylation domain-containing protein